MTESSQTTLDGFFGTLLVTMETMATRNELQTDILRRMSLSLDEIDATLQALVVALDNL